MKRLRIISTTLFNSHPTLVTNLFFNTSHLKSRIQMLVNPQTNRLALLTYSLAIPLLIVLVSLTIACERIADSLSGKPKQTFTVSGRVVDSQSKPVSGVMLYTQTPTGNFKTDKRGGIERTGSTVKTDEQGQFQLNGLDSSAKVEFIYPAYITTVMPLKRLSIMKQVPLFTMAEALKMQNSKRIKELILETIKGNKP